MTLYGEAYVANNYDRGLDVADPRRSRCGRTSGRSVFRWSCDDDPHAKRGEGESKATGSWPVIR
jgi:hypothetical protein